MTRVVVAMEKSKEAEDAEDAESTPQSLTRT
jgi:hypothetical protein